MENWRTLLAIDSDKHACATYAANMPGVEVVCGMVEDRAVSLLDVPEVDVVCGGPPCQPFSRAGKGHGSDDDRDGFPSFLACVRALMPRHVVMENVPGLLDEAHRAYFGAFIADLERIGYEVQYRSLNAMHYGVPQSRERVWTWGIRHDLVRAGMRHRWPMPTHALPQDLDSLFGTLRPVVTVRQALGLHKHAAAIEQGHGNKREAKADLDRASPTLRGCNLPGCGDLIGTFDAQNGVSHTLDVPIGTILSDAQAKGGNSGHYAIKSHADPPRTPDAPASALRSGGDGHDGCRVFVLGGGHNPSFAGDKRTERDITEEPSTTISASHDNALPAIAIRRLRRASVERPDHDIGEPAPTVTGVDGGTTGLAFAYRHSDEMLAKHPPAEPDEPSPTVMGKWAKGGAEDLVRLSADGRTWESRHPVGEPGEAAPTVRARSPRDGGRCTENVVRDGLIVRRLTVEECARLQSMPPDWIWPSSVPKTARYKIIGNGWACLMAKRMGESVRAADPKAHTVIDLFCGGGLGAVGWHGRAWEHHV